eukprot:TRINITY_DN13859_c0_g2_i1.p1 TRINITY_DN13859_c0_g2~~TRINITY_DN13859_c0_g2_i1.p1  ORF type:complete len:1004 (+),score=219.85 TRINITY_DN13859_c0_g2_i1:51-3062(+)
MGCHVSCENEPLLLADVFSGSEDGDARARNSLSGEDCHVTIHKAVDLRGDKCQTDSDDAQCVAVREQTEALDEASLPPVKPRRSSLKISGETTKKKISFSEGDHEIITDSMLEAKARRRERISELRESVRKKQEMVEKEKQAAAEAAAAEERAAAVEEKVPAEGAATKKRISFVEEEAEKKPCFVDEEILVPIQKKGKARISEGKIEVVFTDAQPKATGEPNTDRRNAAPKQPLKAGVKAAPPTAKGTDTSPSIPSKAESVAPPRGAAVAASKRAATPAATAERGGRAVKSDDYPKAKGKPKAKPPTKAAPAGRSAAGSLSSPSKPKAVTSGRSRTAMSSGKSRAMPSGKSISLEASRMKQAMASGKSRAASQKLALEMISDDESVIDEADAPQRAQSPLLIFDGDSDSSCEAAGPVMKAMSSGKSRKIALPADYGDDSDCESKESLEGNESTDNEVRTPMVKKLSKSLSMQRTMISPKDAANEVSDDESDTGGNMPEEEGKAEEDCSSVASDETDTSFSPSRNNRRHLRRKVPLTATMGFTPSQALQLVIDHPDKNVRDFYLMNKSKESMLGKGSFGSVRLCKVKATGAPRAMKAIGKEQMKTRMTILKKEIEISKMVDHPHLVKLYEIFEDDDYIYLVVELCTGGNLFNVVDEQGAMSDLKAACVMQQVMRGVAYMHSSFIVHRDIKPENVLLRDRQPVECANAKVTDFGLSTNFRTGTMFCARVGTATFMSPEVIEKNYDEKCDTWALGVMIFFLMSTQLPFYSNNEDRLFRKTVRAVVDFEDELWHNVSAECVDLASRLIVRVHRRLSLSAALEHSWFNKFVSAKTVPAFGEEVLEKLREFRSLNKLKRAALAVGASMLTDNEVKLAREIFVALDLNGDGQVSMAEMREVLTREGKFEKTQHLWEKFFEDGIDREFTYTEFLAANVSRKNCTCEAILKAVYASLDKNNDQNISLAEVAGGRLLGHLSMEEIATMFEELDKNSDCFIDYQEFKAVMRGPS